MGTVRVFVSSTAFDLGDERKAVKAALERMRGTEFSGMELFGSRDEDARTTSLEEVDDSHLYVGIVGGRYGSGITRDEYDRARERGLACLLYLQSDAAIKLRDNDPAKARSREEWIAVITDSFNGHLVPRFSSANELAAMVAADVHNWLFRRLVRETKAAASAGAAGPLRALLGQTKNAAALRTALLADGVAVGDDLLDSLLALSPGTVAQLLKGIRDLPTDYAARIENFLNEYIGSPEQPVPFGGRADVFGELDAWLDRDPAHPYLLIAAEAGRGKTATLVHWTRRRLGEPRLELVFVPVSIRFRTNLSGVFFPALAARLARAHGDEVPTDVNLPAEVWRGMVADYLREPLPDGRTLVVVLDGLDEAADWEAAADLFPRRAPAGVRIVVSARLTADLPSAKAWFDQLGWDARGARTLPLQSLTLEGVREVMNGMGYPLADVGETIVTTLHRLSEGDPLLIRLYVDELWSRGDEVGRLKPKDLAAIDPGLEGFFDRWWREQKKLWGDSSPLKERGVRTVLNLLAAAFGPLRREDILALAPAESELTTWTLDDAVEPVRRFIIDGSSGLVFSHPRFGQYLWKELIAPERRAMDERFASWSREVRATLSAGDLSAVNVPPYVVQYSGTHLERMSAAPDELSALLMPEWRAAWEAMEGGLAGFATDVARAWRAARRENERLIAAGSSPRQLPVEVLCFLLQTRIRSLGKSLPPVVMGRLVEEKLWSPQQATAYARNMDDSLERVAALTEVARFAEARERSLLLAEARATAGHLEEPKQKAKAQVHLLRAGDPLEPFLELKAREAEAVDDVWVSAGEALVESGRPAEIAQLGVPKYHRNTIDVVHRMLDFGVLDEAELLLHQHQESIRFYEYHELSWRFAVRGRAWCGLDARWPVLRIHELYERSLQALPLSLVPDDVAWIADLFRVTAPFDDLEDFAAAISSAVAGDVRSGLDAEVTDEVIRARLRLADPGEVCNRLQARFEAGNRSADDEYQWLIEAAAIAGKSVIERAVMFAAEHSKFKRREWRYLVRTFLRLDPEALRSAVMRVPTTSPTWGLEFVAMVVALDQAYREVGLQQLMTMYRYYPAWPEGCDKLTRVLDRASLLTLMELFTRIGDRSWSETIRFIFDPREADLPRLAAEWQQSTADASEAFLVAEVVPEQAEAVLRKVVHHPPVGTGWPRMVDFMANLLPAVPAAELREEMWRRMGEEPDRFIDAIAEMSTLPADDVLAGWNAHLAPRVPPFDPGDTDANEEIGRLLLLPASARGAALAALEQRSANRLAWAELGHVAAELSEETIARLVAYATEDKHTLGRSAVISLAPRLTDADARAIFEHATQLEEGERSWLVPFLLPALPEPERSRALVWIVSLEAIARTSGCLIDMAVLCPAIRPVILEAFGDLDPVAVVKTIGRSPHVSVAYVIIAAGRTLDLDPSTARRLALIAIDPSRDKFWPEESWNATAALRLLLRRSSDEALFPGISAAVERAVAIFP
jgi:hypothetical protein